LAVESWLPGESNITKLVRGSVRRRNNHNSSFRVPPADGAGRHFAWKSLRDLSWGTLHADLDG